MQDDLRGQFDQGDGNRRRVLAGDQDAGPLVPHLPHDSHQTRHEVRAFDVLVRTAMSGPERFDRCRMTWARFVRLLSLIVSTNCR